MGGWKTYIFSVILCSLCCEIFSQILADTKARKVTQLVSGILISIVVLQPLTDVNLDDYFQTSVNQCNYADAYIAEGERIAREAQSVSIKAASETYILDKATRLGATILVDVSLNEDLLPASVKISGDPEPSVQIQLQEILTKDLGIPKENQEWIGNQGNNSSQPF